VREKPALNYLDETSDVVREKSQPCSTWMRPMMLCGEKEPALFYLNENSDDV
jgi:hypothetical protein